MSDRAEFYSSNQGEDPGVSMPAETGALEEGASKWVWQIETIRRPSVAKVEGGVNKWVWQLETAPHLSETKVEEGVSKWAWQIETTPLPSFTEVEEITDTGVSELETALLPSVAGLTSTSARLQKVKLEAVPTVSQEVTLKLPAPGKAVNVRQTRVPPWLLTLVTVLFAAFLVFSNLPDRTLNVRNWAGSLGMQLAPGAALIAILVGIGYLARLQHWPSLHIRKWVLAPVMFLLLIAGVLLPQVAINLSLDAQQPLQSPNEQQFSVYKQSNVQPYFSLAYLSDWHSTTGVNNADLTAILFTGDDSNTPAYFIVLRQHIVPGQNVSYQDDLKTYLAALCNGCSFVPQQTTTQGPWHLIHYQEGNHAGIAWIQDINEQRLIMTGLTNPSDMAQDEPTFTTIVNSWSPNLNATVPSTGPTAEQERQIISNRVLPWTSGLLPFLLGLLALPVLWWRRKRPGTIAAGALFFIVLGLLQFTYYLQAFIAPRIPQLQLDFSVSSVLLTIAIGTLLVLCWLLIKRQITRENSRLLTLLLSLNAILAFIAVVLYILLQVSLPPGIAPLAAQLLAGSKVWLQVGLLHLGVPLIITAFILQVASWWGLRKQEAAHSL